MKKVLVITLLLSLGLPAFASTHKNTYSMPCSVLWSALKDTLRNSGKYGIIAIDNTEMTASYNIGGNLTGKRTNSAILNSKDNGTSCELQVQTAYSGLANDDAGDLKKRVDDSLAKLKAAPPQSADSPAPPPPLKPRLPSTPPHPAPISKSTVPLSATRPPQFLLPLEAIKSPSKRKASPTGPRPST